MKIVCEIFMENVYFMLDLNPLVKKKQFYWTLAKCPGSSDVVGKSKLWTKSWDTGFAIQEMRLLCIITVNEKIIVDNISCF